MSSAFSHADIVAVTAASIAERDRRAAGFDLCACGRHGVWTGSEYLCDRCEGEGT